MVLTLRKGSLRGVLLFCLKLVTTDAEDRIFVVREAIRKGVLKDYLVYYGLDSCSLDQQTALILEDAPSLECNVQALAELLTKGKNFVIEHTAPRIDFAIRGVKDGVFSHPCSGGGSIRYTGGELPEISRTEDPGEALLNLSSDLRSIQEQAHELKNCPSSRLTETFFTALRAYREAKQVDFFAIPLKICEWCNQPFFGQRFDQRFCNRDHSQRWHAKKSYEKRKKGQSKPKPISPPANNNSTLVSYKLPQKQ